MYWDEPEPDFEYLEHELRNVSAAMGAAETQGYACGYYVAAGRVTVDVVERAAFGGLDAAAAGCEHGVELLADLIRWTVAGLNDPSAALALLLPDDAQALTQRTQALADWARGYLAGLAEGGYQRRELTAGAIDDWLADFVEISKADAAADAAGDEADYAAVVDYIRTEVVSMLNVLQPYGRAESAH